MEDWNGVSMLCEYGRHEAQVYFFTDASGGFGCGALWQSRWFQLQWSLVHEEFYWPLREESITLKELLPVVVAAALWGPDWRDLSVVVRCDN